MGYYRHIYAGIDFQNCPLTGSVSSLGSAGIMLKKSFLLKYKMTVNFIKPDLNFLDSGGFSVSNHEVAGTIESSGILEQLTTERIMKTANFVNATIVFGLDIPLRGYRDADKQNQEFMVKSRLNLKLAQDAIEQHKQICPTLELFLPLQFYNLNQLKYFLDNLDLRSGPVGAAFPVRELTIKNVIKILYFLKCRGFEKIHLLGTSSLPSIALSAYLARHYFDRVTTDSTNWMMAGMFLKYWQPWTLKAVELKGVKINFDLGDCDCTACRYYNFNEYWKIPKTELAIALGYHNHAVLEQVCKGFIDNCGSIKQLSDFLQKYDFHFMVRRNLDTVISALSVFDGAWKLMGRTMEKFL